MKITITQDGNLDPFCYLVAYSQEGTRVGYAHILRNGENATLTDVHVTSMELPYLEYLPWIKRKACYRNQGVGSQLLKEAIALCQSSYISTLQGNMHGDIEKLQSWYAKHGFSISGKHISYKFRNDQTLMSQSGSSTTRTTED